jgi:hypothetical protein
MGRWLAPALITERAAATCINASRVGFAPRQPALTGHLNGFGWEDRWDNFAGPQARAFHLLKGLDLGRSGSALRQAGQIIFEEFGGSPGNSYTWVELHDDLTVSLLQARLIELNLPIDVEIGTRD